MSNFENQRIQVKSEDFLFVFILDLKQVEVQYVKILGHITIFHKNVFKVWFNLFH